jgi:hypothetical protein
VSTVTEINGTPGVEDGSGVGERVAVNVGVGGRVFKPPEVEVAGLMDGTRVWLTAAATVRAADVYAAPGSWAGDMTNGILHARTSRTIRLTNNKRRVAVGILPPGKIGELISVYPAR